MNGVRNFKRFMRKTFSRKELTVAKATSDDFAPQLRPLSQLSSSVMNTLNSTHSTANDPKASPSIRTVPADSHLQTPSRINTTLPQSDSMPHSTAFRQSASYSVLSQPTPYYPVTGSSPPAHLGNGIVRALSAEFGTRAFSPPINEDTPVTPNGSTPFNAAIGPAANTGKSGRVIERLMGEKDSLTRDLNVAKLQAEEHKQAKLMIEGRLVNMREDYEKQLHDAAVNKTSLKRQDRRVAELQQQVAMEKARANAATEAERKGVEFVHEAARQVTLAETKKMQAETEYATVQNHWGTKKEDFELFAAKKQAEIDRLVNSHKAYIEAMLEKERQQDRKLEALDSLHTQQMAELRKLELQNLEIQKQHELYKKEQEDALQNIKRDAARRIEEAEKKIADSNRALGEMKWAVNVASLNLQQHASPDRVSPPSPSNSSH